MLVETPQECQDAFLHQWAPKCLHCKEPLLKSSRQGVSRVGVRWPTLPPIMEVKHGSLQYWLPFKYYAIFHWTMIMGEGGGIMCSLDLCCRKLGLRMWWCIELPNLWEGLRIFEIAVFIKEAMKHRHIHRSTIPSPAPTQVQWSNLWLWRPANQIWNVFTED